MFIGVSMQLRELSEVSSDPILLVGCTWKKKKKKKSWIQHPSTKSALMAHTKLEQVTELQELGVGLVLFPDSVKGGPSQ